MQLRQPRRPDQERSSCPLMTQRRRRYRLVQKTPAIDRGRVRHGCQDGAETVRPVVAASGLVGLRDGLLGQIRRPVKVALKLGEIAAEAECDSARAVSHVALKRGAGSQLHGAGAWKTQGYGPLLHPIHCLTALEREIIKF